MTQVRSKTAAQFFQAKQLEIEDQYYNKNIRKEKRLYELTSETQMFEMLYYNSKSAPLTITDTLVFEPGSRRAYRKVQTR